MKRGPKPGGACRGYDDLSHQERASFSEYLQALRIDACLSQGGLADAADSATVSVDAGAVKFFESHPAGPLRTAHRRRQLTAICSTLAEWLGKDRGAVLLEVNRRGGGVG